ncbi:peptidase S8/S53 domain-containing protein [Xylaria venustula]|nr:peptidase S8/S53 domain-containing protein [Xylaria venustula]
MSQTRGARKAPSKEQSTPQPSTTTAPSTSGSSFSPTTAQTQSSIRGARQQPQPSSSTRSTSETSKPVPDTAATNTPATGIPIKDLQPPPTVGQIRGHALQGTTMEDGALSVQLKSDSEGVTQAQRDAHVSKIQKLSEPYMTGSESYPGIETALVKLIPAYVGRFHPEVIKEIKASKEVKRVAENQVAKVAGSNAKSAVNSAKEQLEGPFGPEFEVTPNWAAARVTLTDQDFDRRCAYTWKSGWHRNTQHMGAQGKGVTICVVDEGEVNGTDIEQQRILYCEGDVFSSQSTSVNPPITTKTPQDSDANRDPSHSTTVANVACGTKFGIAPKANTWIYTLPEVTYTGILVALEKIALLNASTYIILNISWGLEGWEKDGHMLADALQGLIKSNVLVVVAAGNERKYVDSTCKLWPQNDPSVIVIGNSTSQNNWYGQSNYGPKVDFYAPGVNIPTQKEDFFVSGSSYSGALFSGILANMLSSEIGTSTKHYTIEEIRKLIRENYSRPTHKWTYLPPMGSFIEGEVRTVSAIMQK